MDIDKIVKKALGKDTSKDMTLYHGTSFANFEKIKKQGLKPQPTMWSHKPSIFLTANKKGAKRYAQRSAVKTSSEPVLLKVDMPDTIFPPREVRRSSVNPFSQLIHHESIPTTNISVDTSINSVRPNKLMMARINKLPIYVYTGKEKVVQQNREYIPNFMSYVPRSDITTKEEAEEASRKENAIFIKFHDNPKFYRQEVQPESNPRFVHITNPRVRTREKQILYRAIKRAPNLLGELERRKEEANFILSKGQAFEEDKEHPGKRITVQGSNTPATPYSKAAITVFSEAKTGSEKPEETFFHEIKHLGQSQTSERPPIGTADKVYFENPSEYEAQMYATKRRLESRKMADYPKVEELTKTIGEDSMGFLDEKEYFQKMGELLPTEEEKKSVIEKRKEVGMKGIFGDEETKDSKINELLEAKGKTIEGTQEEKHQIKQELKEHPELLEKIISGPNKNITTQYIGRLEKYKQPKEEIEFGRQMRDIELPEPTTHDIGDIRRYELLQDYTALKNESGGRRQSDVRNIMTNVLRGERNYNKYSKYFLSADLARYNARRLFRSERAAKRLQEIATPQLISAVSKQSPFYMLGALPLNAITPELLEASYQRQPYYLHGAPKELFKTKMMADLIERHPQAISMVEQEDINDELISAYKRGVIQGHGILKKGSKLYDKYNVYHKYNYPNITKEDANAMIENNPLNIRYISNNALTPELAKKAVDKDVGAIVLLPKEFITPDMVDKAATYLDSNYDNIYKYDYDRYNKPVKIENLTYHKYQGIHQSLQNLFSYHYFPGGQEVDNTLLNSLPLQTKRKVFRNIVFWGLKDDEKNKLFKNVLTKDDIIEGVRRDNIDPLIIPNDMYNQEFAEKVVNANPRKGINIPHKYLNKAIAKKIIETDVYKIPEIPIDILGEDVLVDFLEKNPNHIGKADLSNITPSLVDLFIKKAESGGKANAKYAVGAQFLVSLVGQDIGHRSEYEKKVKNLILSNPEFGKRIIDVVEKNPGIIYSMPKYIIDMMPLDKAINLAIKANNFDINDIDLAYKSQAFRHLVALYPKEIKPYLIPVTKKYREIAYQDVLKKPIAPKVKELPINANLANLMLYTNSLSKDKFNYNDIRNTQLVNKPEVKQFINTMRNKDFTQQDILNYDSTIEEAKRKEDYTAEVFSKKWGVGAKEPQFTFLLNTTAPEKYNFNEKLHGYNESSGHPRSHRGETTLAWIRAVPIGDSIKIIEVQSDIDYLGYPKDKMVNIERDLLLEFIKEIKNNTDYKRISLEPYEGKTFLPEIYRYMPQRLGFKENQKGWYELDLSKSNRTLYADIVSDNSVTSRLIDRPPTKYTAERINDVYRQAKWRTPEYQMFLQEKIDEIRRRLGEEENPDFTKEEIDSIIDEWIDIMKEQTPEDRQEQFNTEAEAMGTMPLNERLRLQRQQQKFLESMTPEQKYRFMMAQQSIMEDLDIEGGRTAMREESPELKEEYEEMRKRNFKQFNEERAKRKRYKELLREELLDTLDEEGGIQEGIENIFNEDVDAQSKNSKKPWHKEIIPQKKQDYIMSNYLNKVASNVKINNNKIQLNYDGHNIVNKFKAVPYRKDIASWAHMKDKNTLYYSKQLQPKRVPGVLVHEAVEQYVSEKKGLSYNRAHEVALVAEEDYVKHNLHQHWGGYQNSVLNTKG